MRDVLNDSVSLVVGDKVFDNGRFTNSVDTTFMPLNSLSLSQHRPLADERRSFLLCNFPATLIRTDGVAVLNWIDENNFIEVTCRPVAIGAVGDPSVGAVPIPGLKLWDSVPHNPYLSSGTPRTADELGLGWSNDVVASMNIGTGGLLGGGAYYSTGFWQANGVIRSAWAGFKYAGHMLAIRQWKNGQPTWLGSSFLRASTGVSYAGVYSQIELNEAPIVAENYVGVSAWCYQVFSGGRMRIRVIATATKSYNGSDMPLGGQTSSAVISNEVYAESDTGWSPVGGVMLGRSRDLWNDETDYGQVEPNGARFPTAFRRVFDAEEVKDGNIGGPLATPWLTPDPNVTDSFFTGLTSDYPFRGIIQARYLGNFSDDYPESTGRLLSFVPFASHTRTSDYNLPPFDTNAGGWQQPFAKDCPCHPDTILIETYLGTNSASINAPAEGEDATAAQLAVAAAPWGAAFQGVQPKGAYRNWPSIVGSPITGQMRTGADYGENPGEMSDDFVAARGVQIYTDYPMPTSYSEHTTHYLYPYTKYGIRFPDSVRMMIAPSPREKLLEGSPVALRSFRQWLPTSIELTGDGSSNSASFSKINYCTVDMGYTGAVDDPTNSNANRNVVIQSSVHGHVSITPLIGNPANWAAVYGGPPANFINDDLFTIKSIWSMRLTIVETIVDGYSPYESGAGGLHAWPSMGGFGLVRGPTIARSMFEFGGVLMPSTKFASPNMVGPGNDESAWYRETGYAGQPTQASFFNARSKLDAPSGEVVPGSPPVGTEGEQRVLLSSYPPLIDPPNSTSIVPDTSDVADVTNTPNIINNIRVGYHSCRCGFVLRPTDNRWYIGHPGFVYSGNQLDNICHFYGQRPYFLMGEHYPTDAYPGTPFGQSAASWSGPEAGRILATDPYCQGRYAELSFSLVE
jgi:hypothetical protein